MEIRKRKPVKTPARPGQQPQPINSTYAAEVRRRAEMLTTPVEKQDEPGASARNLQRQQAERQMAKLRSDAVQARRLAAHIENLSHGSAAYKHERKQAMTETTIIDPGHAQRLQRRAQDKPATRGKQMNFNPLHPSMELPPEQLIRLLGMESKKIRKSRKACHAPRRATAAESTTVDTQTTAAEPQTLRPADRSIQYERNEAPQVFDNGRSGLLVPASLVGVVAGIAVSGYLFWFQPAEPDIQSTPAPAVTGQPQAQQPGRNRVERSAAPAQERKMTAQESAKWQATIKAREGQLRSAAEQRLAERIQQSGKEPRTTLQGAALQGNTPALPVTPAATVVTSPEPVADTVTPTDVPAAAATPPEPVLATDQATPGAEPVPAETTGVMEAAELSLPPVTSPEQATDLSAPAETMPEPDAVTGSESPADEPAPAVPAVIEGATGIEAVQEPGFEATTPATGDVAAATSETPVNEPSPDTVNDVLF